MPSDTYILTIADAGVSTPADGSVTTVKIADYNVGIAGTGVTTAKIVDSNVTTAKLAAGAVTTAKLVDSSSTTTGVTTAKIADDAVTTAKILNLAVTTAKLESYSSGSTGVTTPKIADLAVTTAKLADGAVTDAKITDGTISNAKLATISTALKVSNSATTATSANTLSAIVARDGSGNFSAGIITAALTGNATTASSIAGGTAGAIPYQTGAGTTQFTLVGTAGQLLVSNGAAAPTWGSAVGGVSSGGTGIYSYAAGDIIYADGATSLTKRAIGPAGSVLTSSGTSPVYLPTLPVASGGTGAASLTGYVKANGTAVMTANATIPVTDGGTGTNGTSINSLSFDKLKFKTASQSTDALNSGEVRWNTTDNTLDLKLVGDVTLQIGQESNIYVHNSEPVDTIPNGSVVYVHGAASDNVAVKLATNANITSSKTLGVATQSITAGSHGYITTQGLVRGLDTSAFTSGDSLWLGVGGALTATEPVFPATAVRMAIVVRDDVEQGSIYVQPQLFSDGRVSGSFRWAATGTGAGSSSSGPHSIVGLTSTSSVIIQERGATPVGSMYSVVCSTDSFTVYARADSGNSATGTLPLKETMFSYIAFI